MSGMGARVRKLEHGTDAGAPDPAKGRHLLHILSQDKLKEENGLALVEPGDCDALTFARIQESLGWARQDWEAAEAWREEVRRLDPPIDLDAALAAMLPEERERSDHSRLVAFMRWTVEIQIPAQCAAVDAAVQAACRRLGRPRSTTSG